MRSQPEMMRLEKKASRPLSPLEKYVLHAMEAYVWSDANRVINGVVAARTGLCGRDVSDAIDSLDILGLVEITGQSGDQQYRLSP